MTRHKFKIGDIVKDRHGNFFRVTNTHPPPKGRLAFRGPLVDLVGLTWSGGTVTWGSIEDFELAAKEEVREFILKRVLD